MTYQDYIELGFERTDVADSVQFKETGYYGYFLSKDITERVSIQVYDSSLDDPKLYVEKPCLEQFHIMRISTDAVKDIFNKNTK